MTYAFRLGPIASGGPPVFAYVGLDEGGAPHIHMAPTDREGLEALRAAARGGALSCEPSLAEAGQSLGIEPAPLPSAVLRQRAALAYELACGVEHGASKPEAIAAFLQGAAAFWGARTWEVVAPTDRLQVTFTVGRNEHAGEISVLGGDGAAPGLVLCDEPRAIQRLAGLEGPERVREVRRLAGLAIEMETEPAWAAAAIGQAFTLTRVPTPVRTRGGRVASVATQDLVMAAALLESVAAYAGVADGEQAEAEVEAAGLVVGARVTAASSGLEAASAQSSVGLTPARPREEEPAPARAPPAVEPERAAPPEAQPGEGWLARTWRVLRGSRERPGEASARSAGAPSSAGAATGAVPEVVPAEPAPAPATAEGKAPATAEGTAPATAEGRAPATAEGKAPARAEGTATVRAVPPPPEDPFAPFARALRIELPAEPPTPPAEEEGADAALAARILDRAAAPGSELVSFPAVALQIIELVSSPKADAASIAGFISRDPALSAGVVSVANSAAFRGLSEVESVRDAVARLGLQEVGRVASAVSARAVLDAQGPTGKRAGPPGQLFTRAVAVSWTAAAAAMRQRGARTDHVYLGGLLHDVGRALAARALAGLLADGGGDELTATVRAERVLDRVHVEVGEAALRRWGLPQYLQDMGAHHHDAIVPPELVDLHLVRLSSALALLREPALAGRAAREIVQSAAALGLEVRAVRALAADLHDAEQRAAALSR
jgi:putative nucleotidyltransferase with HDIG domain